MRPHLIAEVEKLISREVVAFMSDNHIDPDLATETFILVPTPSGAVEAEAQKA